MAGKGRFGNPVPVSDLANELLDPVLRRRTGLSIELIQSWNEIVGDRLSESTRPEKLAWPRRHSEDDPFKPATLVIACEGMAALHLQHETGELIERVNGFLGFPAVARIKIVQKPVGDSAPKKTPPRPLTREETGRLAEITAGVENEGLRKALENLGANVLRSASKGPITKS